MPQNMKVTLIISSLAGGGAEKVCVNIANGLAKIGWNVDLVLLNLKKSSYLFNVSENVNLVELKVNHARYATFSLLKYIYKNKPNLFLAFNYELTVLISSSLKFTRILIFFWRGCGFIYPTNTSSLSLFICV